MNRQIIVIKTGVGKDRYEWSDVALELDHGVLLVRDNEEVLLHAYSPGAWLEVYEVTE